MPIKYIIFIHVQLRPSYFGYNPDRDNMWIDGQILWIYGTVCVGSKQFLYCVRSIFRFKSRQSQNYILYIRHRPQKPISKNNNVFDLLYSCVSIGMSGYLQRCNYSKYTHQLSVMKFFIIFFFQTLQTNDVYDRLLPNSYLLTIHGHLPISLDVKQFLELKKRR